MPYPLEVIGDGSIADRNFRNLAKDMSPPVPQARVFNSANISIADSTFTALTFDSERYDNGSLHDTGANTSRLTAPITGLYAIGACLQWAASAAGRRQARLRLNGTAYIDMIEHAPSAAGATTVQDPGTDYRLTAGDYVEVVVFQSSGGALNVEAAANYSPEFWMHRVGGYVNQGV